MKAKFVRSTRRKHWPTRKIKVKLMKAMFVRSTKRKHWKPGIKMKSWLLRLCVKRKRQLKKMKRTIMAKRVWKEIQLFSVQMKFTILWKHKGGRYDIVNWIIQELWFRSFAKHIAWDTSRSQYRPFRCHLTSYKKEHAARASRQQYGVKCLFQSYFWWLR